MHAEWLAAVRQRFHADDWTARAASAPALFVWSLSLRRVELPGWTCQRVRETPASDELRSLPAADPKPEGELRIEIPTVSQGLWRNPGRPGVLLKADLFECASREQAVEILLRLLGEFESPLIAQKTEAPGDVAFGGRGDGLLLFRRGNIVCLCRNAERAIASVMPIAEGLDRAAYGGSTGTRRRLVTAEPPARLGHQQDGEFQGGDDQERELEVPLLDAAMAHRADGTIRRFVAPDGDILLKGDSIVYRGSAASARRLEIEEGL